MINKDNDEQQNQAHSVNNSNNLEMSYIKIEMNENSEADGMIQLPKNSSTSSKQPNQEFNGIEEMKEENRIHSLEIHTIPQIDYEH